MGLSKDMKRKGPQTTRPGTKIYRVTEIGRTRPDGTWSGKATRGPIVVAKLPKEETSREEKARQARDSATKGSTNA